MRRLIWYPILFLAIVFMSGCEKEQEIYHLSLVNKTWIESHEENTSTEDRIFRTGEYEDFPPAWYRQVFNFNSSGVCEYLVLAADDGHYMAKGSWKYSERTDIIRIYNSASEKLYEFEIVQVTDEMLRLKENS